MRKLATIRKISEIKPIEGADKIELAVLDGWQVIIKKGEYQVNDLVVYLEIDSWVPNELAPFLTPEGKEPKEYNGVKGERLRTKKLRGVLSQGLILPLSVLGKPEEIFTIGEGCIGADVSEELGIQKWEPTLPLRLRGLAKGSFPSWVPKTDQERIQNLRNEFESYKKEVWQVTEKLHGSSCTFALDLDGNFEVCSRNLSLKFDENNAYWKAALKYDVERKMKEADLLGYAIQGEIIGEGINGNQYKTDLEFYVFNIFSVHEGKYLAPSKTESIAKELDLKHVPVLEYCKVPDVTLQELLVLAEGKSALNGSNREGLVYKSEDGKKSFKVISNNWLLKNE